ncbi:MAG TPA: hypothetical protein VEY30_10290 [Myxococcaceae bacterium]|nr:hypothetical protein [Myxococcaceae bacterium]
MAHAGDLVKMENGRWARYQQMPISTSDGTDFRALSILVAVELDEEWQARLEGGNEPTGVNAVALEKSRTESPALMPAFG